MCVGRRKKKSEEEEEKQKKNSSLQSNRIMTIESGKDYSLEAKTRFLRKRNPHCLLPADYSLHTEGHSTDNLLTTKEKNDPLQ